MIDFIQADMIQENDDTISSYLVRNQVRFQNTAKIEEKHSTL